MLHKLHDAKGNHGDHGCISSYKDEEGDLYNILAGEVAWFQLLVNKLADQVILWLFESESDEVRDIR